MNSNQAAARDSSCEVLASEDDPRGATRQCEPWRPLKKQTMTIGTTASDRVTHYCSSARMLESRVSALITEMYFETMRPPRSMKKVSGYPVTPQRGVCVPA